MPCFLLSPFPVVCLSNIPIHSRINHPVASNNREDAATEGLHGNCTKTNLREQHCTHNLLRWSGLVSMWALDVGSRETVVYFSCLTENRPLEVQFFFFRCHYCHLVSDKSSPYVPLLEAPSYAWSDTRLSCNLSKTAHRDPTGVGNFKIFY